MRTYVIDTSVVVKWYNENDEKYVIQARQILQDLRYNKISIIVSDLLSIELTNVFLKGKSLVPSEIITLLQNFFSLPLIVKETSESQLSRAAVIAYKNKITVYDALYIALAESLSCQLISDDQKAHGKLEDDTVLMLKKYHSSKE